MNIHHQWRRRPSLPPVVCILLLWMALAASCIAQSAIPIPDVEAGQWNLWNRDDGAGTLVFDAKEVHDGKPSAHMEHRGERDWSLQPAGRTDVESGDIFELSGWAKMSVPEHGSLTLCASTWDSQGANQSWDSGASRLSATCNWTQLKSRFVIPPGVSQIQVRVIGDGTAQAWLSGISLVKAGNVLAQRGKDFPASFKVENAMLAVTLNSSDATFSVFDKRPQHGSQRATEHFRQWQGRYC